MNYEAPLTRLVWLTSIVSVGLTYCGVANCLIPVLGGDPSLWWKLSTIITCGTLAGAIIPEIVKIFTSTESSHVREVVTSSEQGGASLNILSGLVAGNFSAYWLGIAIIGLMSDRVLGARAFRRLTGLAQHRHDCAGCVRLRPRRFRLPRHGSGDDRGRFLRTGHRQRAVGLRAVDDRADPRHRRRPEEELRLRRQLREGQAQPRRERRRGQHVQGDGQARPHRHGGRRRDDDDLLDRRGSHERARAGARRPTCRFSIRRFCWASSPAGR